MPTTLPRTNLTHTPPIRAALTRAALRWPDDPSPTVLLTRIAEDWMAADRDGDELAVDATAGKYSGVFAPGYLDDLRSEWDR